MRVFERLLMVIGNRKVTKSLVMTVLLTVLAFVVVMVAVKGAAETDAEILVVVLLLMMGAFVVFGFRKGSSVDVIGTVVEAVKDTDERSDDEVTQPEPTPDEAAIKAVGSESASKPL